MPREIVWQTVSDIDNDPYFWKGITSTRNLFKNENTLVREVILGEDNICTQLVTTWPIEKIRVQWIKGVIKGVKEILLISLGDKTLFEVQMNYEFPGIGRSDSRLLAKLFQNEAELAADLIKRISETQDCETYLTARKLWVN